MFQTVLGCLAMSGYVPNNTLFLSNNDYVPNNT